MIFNFGAAVVCLEEEYFSAISHDQGWSWKLELATNLREDYNHEEGAYSGILCAGIPVSCLIRRLFRIVP